MSIDFPCAFGDSNTALPIEFDIQCFVFLIFIGHDCLFVGPLKRVSIGVVPGASFVGLVIGKLALVVGTVGEDPSALDKRL